MDVRASVVWIIVGTGAVTVIPRVAPLVLLSRITLPGWVIRWLGYVPIAVLAALLAQTVALSNGHLALPPRNLGMLAAIPTLLVAVYTRSMIGTVLCGVVTMAMLRAAFG